MTCILDVWTIVNLNSNMYIYQTELLWLTAMSLMSQVPAPGYCVAVLQFKALILWFCSLVGCRPPLHSKPKVQRHSMNLTSRHEICWTGDLFIWCEQTGVKTFLQKGYQNGKKTTMFIYELHPGKSVHFEPKVMEVDGEQMIFLESIGWWKWFQSLPQGTNPCDILNVKPCLGLQQHLNLPKLLAKYFLLSPKHVHLRNHRNLLSSFSKSWTLDQQP